jgi:hypothetical protein
MTDDTYAAAVEKACRGFLAEIDKYHSVIGSQEDLGNVLVDNQIDMTEAMGAALSAIGFREIVGALEDAIRLVNTHEHFSLLILEDRRRLARWYEALAKLANDKKAATPKDGG